MYLHTCINSSFGRCIFAAKTYCNPIMERLDEILEIVREIREDIAYMKRHRNMLCGTPVLEVSEVCDLLKISDRQLRRYCVSGQLKTMLDRANPLFDTDYAFTKVYLLATAAENASETFAGTEKAVQGWVDCFPRCALAGTVFAGGVNGVGEIAGHVVLEQAYQMGKEV